MTSLQEKCWIKKLNPERHLPILQKPGRLWRAPLSFLGKIHKNCSLVQWASLLCWKQAQGFTTGKIVSQWWPDTRLALWACPLGAAECAPCPNSENSHTHNLLGSGLLFFFFFFFAAKSFIVSLWSKAWERAPGWLKSCLVAAERGFRQKPWHQRSSSKTAGLQSLLVVLEAEPLEEILA